MNPLPGAGVCQGNFAASVKEILPIYQCDALATAGSIDSNPPHNYRHLRQELLDSP